MKKHYGPHIPMSDCECYMEALDLVEQALEENQKYIFLNEWLAQNICDGYTQNAEDIANLVRDGKKLLYFSTHSGNLYISNGYIDTEGGYTKIYFSIYPECDDVARAASGAWIGDELTFYPNSNYTGSMRSVLMNVDSDMSKEIDRGFVPPANALGILKSIDGVPIQPEHIYYFDSNGYIPVVSLNTVNFSSFVTFYTSWQEIEDGVTWNFRYNGVQWSNHSLYPYIRVTKQTVGSNVFNYLVVIDET